MQKKIKQAKKYLEWGKPNQAIAELKPTLNSSKIQKEFKWVPNHLMGIALSLQGDNESAIRYLKKAVKHGSEQPETFYLLSESYFKLERFEKAEEFAEEAVALNNDFLKAWMKLGEIYQSQAKLNEALRCYKEANRIDPKNAEVAFNIGRIYRDQGDLDQAMKLFDITLQVEEDHLKAMLERADLLKNNGRLDDALEKLEEAKEKNGSHPAIKVSKAEVLKAEGDYDQAIELYEEILADFSENGPLLINYALCLQEVGRFDKSEKHYREAIALMDDPRNAISNYLMGLHYNPENSREYIFNEHIQYCKEFIPEEGVNEQLVVDSDPNKKLKIGFLSGGFRRHPVGWMIAGALEQLQDEDFELVCYTTDNRFDFITRRIHRNIDQWKSIIGYSDEVIKNIILDDELDILVDLTGHAADNCMNVMGHKPAPIMVKWVGGLFNTTGLEAFDYLITDYNESPKGEEQYYTEKLVRMPDDYIVYAPPAYAPDVEALPAKENGYITFGCFNNPTKVNERVLRHWADIMQQVPESRLYLKSKQYDTASFREQILEVMGSESIAIERIEFEGRTGHEEHLAAYNKVDIALDPWPYSGGLTTCEALYMGVPVTTMPGPTFAGRHSTTHLINAGLEQWVTDSWDEYTEKAVALANDLDELKEWRSKLRDQLLNSPVCDGKRFGAHLSVAFREMWKQRLEGYKTNDDEWQDHISIDPLSDEQVKELTDGPEVTPLITIKDEEPTKQESTTEGNHNTEMMNESVLDTEELVQGIEQLENGNELGEESPEHSSTNGSAERKQEENYSIETKDGVSICTPPDTDILTTYVLLEQEEWFESELNFVRDYLQPGMTVIDAGAGFGAYSLPIAKWVGPEGAVFAFEPGAMGKQNLEKSKIENGFDHLEVVGRGLGENAGEVSFETAETPELNRVSENGEETVPLTSLDAWWGFAGKPEIDFMKVDVNGMEADVLAGGSWMFEETKPVVLVSIGENEESFTSLQEQLKGYDYRMFEYIPGPGVLAEYDSEAGIDPYQMNVVAIPESRIEEFKENGWIFDESVEVEATDQHRWKEMLKNQPWAESKVDAWDDKVSTGNHEEYLEALNLACAAEQMDVSDEDPKSKSRKAAAMLMAAQKLIGLFNNGQAGVAAAMIYVRLMSQLGKQSQAVEMAKQLMETVNSGQDISVDLPFLPPLPEQDTTDIQTDFSKWLTVRVVEAWISLQNPTTYMASEQEQGMLEALEGNPEISDGALKKAIDLKTSPESLGRLNADEDNEMPVDHSNENKNAVEVNTAVNGNQVIDPNYWTAPLNAQKAQVAHSVADKLRLADVEEVRKQAIKECQARIDQDGTDSIAFYILVNTLLASKDSGRVADGKLMQRLKKKNWEYKKPLYAYFYDRIEVLNQVRSTETSVVVVSNNVNDEVIKNLKELNRQRDDTTEIIFVSNGLSEDSTQIVQEFVDKLIYLKQNAGACMARNFGALFSGGDIFIFIDDDGIPENGLIKAHKDVHEKRDVYIARGVYLPKKENGEIPWHYDLGPDIKPAVCFLEGNTSFKPKPFFKTGGWNDSLLVYHEGLELSYRYYCEGYDQEKLIYFPDAVLRHDYVKPPAGQNRKQKLLRISHLLIHTMYDDVEKVIKNWPKGFKDDVIKGRFSIQDIGKNITFELPKRVNKTLHLHIGSEKTGTTSIQNLFHQNRRELLEQGFRYPGQDSRHFKLHFAAKPSKEDWLWHFKWFDRKELLKNLEGYYSELEKDFASGYRDNIMSAEFLFLDKTEQIKNIISYLNNFFSNIKVYVFVRNPVTFYKSFQQERIKQRSYIKSPKYFYYNFRDVIEAWEKFVEVIPIEYSSNRNSSKILCEKIGVDFCSLKNENKRSRESLSVEQMTVLEQIQKSFYPNKDLSYKPHLAIMRSIKPPFVTKPLLKEGIKPIVYRNHFADLEWLRDEHAIDFIEQNNGIRLGKKQDEDTYNEKKLTVKDIFKVDQKLVEKYESFLLNFFMKKIST